MTLNYRYLISNIIIVIFLFIIIFIVGKTGDLFRALGAGPGLRGLGFRDRALGPRKPITK